MSTAEANIPLVTQVRAIPRRWGARWLEMYENAAGANVAAVSPCAMRSVTTQVRLGAALTASVVTVAPISPPVITVRGP